MVQTGDPTGTGMGGESIWGGEFEDEFHATLRHDRPYTLSMANGGPGTNGSQFFLTVVPTVSHLSLGRGRDYEWSKPALFLSLCTTVMYCGLLQQMYSLYVALDKSICQMP